LLAPFAGRKSNRMSATVVESRDTSDSPIRRVVLVWLMFSGPRRYSFDGLDGD